VLAILIPVISTLLPSNVIAAIRRCPTGLRHAILARWRLLCGKKQRFVTRNAKSLLQYSQVVAGDRAVLLELASIAEQAFVSAAAEVEKVAACE
jgi:hypothetical protein